MPDPAPNAELMRALGRLVRGLSALFWGLPAALVVCFYVARFDSLQLFGILPPLISMGLLTFGLWQLGAFQRQERVWRSALDVARLLSLVNLGLSPFLYWSSKIPGNGFFLAMVLMLEVSALLFLASLNVVLQRLGAMLPDEALRVEIKQFTRLNLNLLGVSFFLGAAYLILRRLPDLPPPVELVLEILGQRGELWLHVMLIPLVLLPLAMTMALLWKTKEVILDSVFGAKP